VYTSSCVCTHSSIVSQRNMSVCACVSERESVCVCARTQVVSTGPFYIFFFFFASQTLGNIKNQKKI